MPRMQLLLPRLAAPSVLILASFLGCTTTSDSSDAGLTTGPGGFTIQDIGSRCVCELVSNPISGATECKQAPTNSCKTGMVCVVDTPAANVVPNAGNPLFEAPLFRRAVSSDGGFLIEGECTLTYAQPLANSCPTGSRLLLLSSGLYVCKRTCQADAECGRAGYVCDAPLLSRDAIDLANPPSETPLALNFCRPACQADFPDCNRSTTCTMGAPGCQRSAFTRNAPQDLGIYIGDRNGARVCNTTTGHCEGVASRAGGFVGDPCASHADCQPNFLCVSDNAYSQAPDGVGFCTYANCNPAAADGESGSCVQGLTCEWAFDMGMCFPNCTGGTLCSRIGTKCAIPDPGLMASFDPASGAAVSFKAARCVDCDTTGVCP